MQKDDYVCLTIPCSLSCTNPLWSGFDIAGNMQDAERIADSVICGYSSTEIYAREIERHFFLSPFSFFLFPCRFVDKPLLRLR